MPLLLIFLLATATDILSGGPASSDALKEAEKALQAKKIAHAVEVLRHAIEVDPDNAELLGMLGVAYCAVQKGENHAFAIWSEAVRRGASIKIQGYLAKGAASIPGWFSLNAKTVGFHANDKSYSFEIPLTALRKISMMRKDEYLGQSRRDGGFVLAQSANQAAHAITLRGSGWRTARSESGKEGEITGTGKAAFDLIKNLMPSEPTPAIRKK